METTDVMDRPTLPLPDLPPDPHNTAGQWALGTLVGLLWVADQRRLAASIISSSVNRRTSRTVAVQVQPGPLYLPTLPTYLLDHLLDYIPRYLPIYGWPMASQWSQGVCKGVPPGETQRCNPSVVITRLVSVQRIVQTFGLVSSLISEGVKQGL